MTEKTLSKNMGRYLKVRARAGMRKERVEQKDADTFLIEVREKAERGEANERIRELLAQALTLPESRLRLVKGVASPSKRYLLSDNTINIAMKTNIKFTDTPKDDTLRAYVDSKIAAFAKLLHEKDFESAVCDVELRRSTHHKKGAVCYAEVTLRAGGKVYRASKEEPTLKKAIDKVKDDVLVQLRQKKETQKTALKRGGARAKEALL